MRLIILLFLIVVLVAACNSAVQEWEAAQQALVDYFTLLSQGHYSKAMVLYGGSYEPLIEMNPEINSFDLDRLWQNGCTINGLQCLPVSSATLKEQVGSTFVFTLAFSNPDGSRFALGPCCGASASESPPVEHFDYRVEKTNAGYRVLDLPVFVP